MALEKWAHHVFAYLVCGGAFLWGFVALGGYSFGRSAFYAVLVLAGWHVIVLLQHIARSTRNADARIEAIRLAVEELQKSLPPAPEAELVD